MKDKKMEQSILIVALFLMLCGYYTFSLSQSGAGSKSEKEETVINVLHHNSDYEHQKEEEKFYPKSNVNDPENFMDVNHVNFSP